MPCTGFGTGFRTEFGPSPNYGSPPSAVKGKKAELIERLRKHDADDGSEREMDSNTEEEEEENASSSEEGD